MGREVYASAGMGRPRVMLTIHNMDNSGECRQDEFAFTGTALPPSLLTFCLKMVEDEHTSIVGCATFRAKERGSISSIIQGELAILRAPWVQACLVIPLPRWREPWTRGPLGTTQSASAS